MNQEIELKLELDADQSELFRSDPLLKGLKSRPIRQVSTYYDTPGAMLAKNGFSLRIRSLQGTYVQTLKRTSPDKGLFMRDEWEWDVDSDQLDGTKLEGLADALPTSPKKLLNKLHPVFRSDVDRTTWQVRQGRSEMQVDWDHGTVEVGSRSLEFAEVEFELQCGQPADVVAAARALAGRVRARLGVLSKAERGAALAKGIVNQVAKSEPVSVERSMTVAEAFSVIVHACLKHYRLNEALVIRSQSAEALHQSRVAMRRLRSALSFFNAAIADSQYLQLREELRWFTAQLSDARNLDVYLERDLAQQERESSLRSREDAYRQVAETMNSARLRLLLIDLMAWSALGKWRRGKLARRRIRGFARKRLDKLWWAIEAARGNLEQMDENSRHKLRIQVKKMRYAVEFFRDVYPNTKRKKRFYPAIECLQESLGKLNDIVTARALTADIAEDELSETPDTLEHLRVSKSCLKRVAYAGPFWRPSKA